MATPTQKMMKRIKEREITINDMLYWFNIIKDNNFEDKETLKLTLANLKKLHIRHWEYLRNAMKDRSISIGKIALIDEDILQIEEMINILSYHKY